LPLFIARSDQLAAIADNPNPVGDEDLIDLPELRRRANGQN
jgi:hypothetical protein